VWEGVRREGGKGKQGGRGKKGRDKSTADLKEIDDSLPVGLLILLKFPPFVVFHFFLPRYLIRPQYFENSFPLNI